MLSRTRPPWAARYGAAALAVALAFLLNAVLDPFLQEASTFLLLSAAVLAAAAYGGLGPGVFATLLGGVAGDYLFLPPVGTLVPPSAEHGLTTALFITQGLAISVLGAWLAEARRRAQESALRATEDRRSLGESEERFRLLVEGAKDFAIFMTDTDGRVTTWNEGARRVFGYEEGEIVGEDASKLFTPEDREGGRHERELRKARTEGRAEDERWHVRKDGSRFWASGYVRPVRNEGGDLLGFSKVARDETERKRAEEALHEIREAERARVARDLHDGPLQDLAYGLAVVHIAGMDLRNDDPGAAATTIARADEALGRVAGGLRAAVHDLRLGGERGRPLLALVEALVERERSMVPGCAVSLEVQEGFPTVPAGGAGAEVLRVVGEALTNARRHSGAENVRVSLGLDGDFLVAEVSDDGRGFGPERAPGIGRGSMRERAAALGGDLEVESEPGEGTRVRLRVPASEALRDAPRGESGTQGEGR